MRIAILDPEYLDTLSREALAQLRNKTLTDPAYAFAEKAVEAATRRRIETSHPRAMWQVLVDGTALAHGPYEPTRAWHPDEMAATYREINPGALVTIQYRAADSDEWTDDESNSPCGESSRGVD